MIKDQDPPDLEQAGNVMVFTWSVLGTHRNLSGGPGQCGPGRWIPKWLTLQKMDWWKNDSKSNTYTVKCPQHVVSLHFSFIISVYLGEIYDMKSSSEHDKCQAFFLTFPSFSLFPWITTTYKHLPWVCTHTHTNRHTSINNMHTEEWVMDNVAWT